MKKFIFLHFFLFLGSFSFSQDTILMANGERITALVNSVSTTEVEYKKFDNQTGPLYVKNKNEIKAIYYKNGTSDVFPLTTSNSKNAEPDDYYGSSTNANGLGEASTSITISDIVSASQIVFYGIDFSNFKLVEGKRKKESNKIRDIQYPEWNNFFIKEVPARTMERWLKKSTIIYSTEVVTKSNSQVDPSTIVIDYLDLRNMKPLIKNTVSNYAALDSRNSGIGFVICIDYFSKARTETSAYFTFFDIATHSVILSEQIKVREVKGAGLTNFWGAGLIAAMKDYVDYRYKGY